MPTLNIEITDSQLQELKDLTENTDVVSGGLASTIGGFVAGWAAGKAIDGLIDSVSNPRSDYGSVDIIGA